jgi:protein ImuB
MYACIYIPGLGEEQASALRACAEAFSPNIEFTHEAAILDIRGLRSLYGPPESIGKAIAQRVADMGARVGIASNPHAAMAAARGFVGLTVIPPGEEGQALSSLPLDFLTQSRGRDTAEDELHATLSSWRIETFADLAALPEDGIAERLGSAGVRLRRLARGMTTRPLVPAKEDLTFKAEMQLEFALELLEPLMFILSRLLTDICGSLASHSLAANELELVLDLEKNREYTRTLHLPFATRDAQTFLKLLQYDLSAHPPKAAIVGVHLTATPVHPRVVQGGLFIPLAPQPEKLELTLARIAAIVGQGNAGTPDLIDTHRPGAFRLTRFEAKQADAPGSIPSDQPRLAIRIYRPPLPAIVAAPNGHPERVNANGVNGPVCAYAGPWRTSGDWITQQPWACDEWDIALQAGGVYRLRHNATNEWFVDGNYD